MTVITHLAMEELSAGLEHIRQSPKERGVLEMIVRRPHEDAREPLEQGRLDPEQGLAGDDWRLRRSGRTPDGTPNPDTQLTLMNARAIAMMAGTRERWPLAGDQLFVDLDLSYDNLPPGTRLEMGSAVIEITAEAHNGCGKFVERFGLDAMKFVNSPVGKAENLRGIYAKVVEAGTIGAGDEVRKVAGSTEG
jgi:hypothetical protein